MSSAAFNLDTFDDGPTLVTASPVFHTAVMDRRQMPPPISGVMPVSRPHAAPPTSVRAQKAWSPDVTQPALRIRRDLAGTRRLAVGLAIGFAFVFGLAGAFVFQTLSASAAPVPMAARAPREVNDRTSTLATRSTPDAVPRADEAPLAAAARPRPKRVSAPPSAAPVASEAGETEPSADDTSIEGRDLLGEGLGAP
jgi:hypothetical protein